MGRDARKHVAQVVKWVATDGNASQSSFCRVIVKPQSRIVGEARECRPLIAHTANRLGGGTQRLVEREARTAKGPERVAPWTAFSSIKFTLIRQSKHKPTGQMVRRPWL